MTKALFGIIGAPLLCSGLLLAQSGVNTPMPQASGTPEADNGTRSWTGLLVASGCDAGPTANQMSEATAGQRTTSPKETNMDYEQRVSQADRADQASAPETTTGVVGTADRATPTSGAASSDDERWTRAQQIAHQMPDSCRITNTTTSFALRLRDGRVVNFDSAGNGQIRQQLESNGQIEPHQMKIFRVIVTGDLAGDTITLNSIRL